MAQNTGEQLPDEIMDGVILVVDDDSINRLALRELLRLRNYKVVLANNGQEALDLLKKNKFDLIIMDIQMPVLGGLEATEIIKHSEEYAEHSSTPIIALTAFAMASDIEKFFKCGIQDYMAKPVEAEDLYAAIERNIST